jgi:hypothetical protein
VVLPGDVGGEGVGYSALGSDGHLERTTTTTRVVDGHRQAIPAEAASDCAAKPASCLYPRGFLAGRSSSDLEEEHLLRHDRRVDQTADQDRDGHAPRADQPHPQGQARQLPPDRHEEQHRHDQTGAVSGELEAAGSGRRA